MSFNQTRLFFGKPIPVNKDISIIQPKISQIIEMEKKYDDYLLPFTITLDAIFDDEEVISKVNLFELFFEKTSENTPVLQKVFNGNPVDIISESITFFTGREVKVLENRKKIIIGDSYILDKLSYVEFRKIIQAISTRKDLKIEKMPKNLSERRKDIWIKLQEGRRRKAEREAMKLEDIANVISFGGKSHIPFEQVLDMTYYQFINAYKTIIGIDSYFVGLEYKVSQKYEYKDELEHWSKTIKIQNEFN